VMKDAPIIIVSGPTAAGKTVLALRLAEYFDGEIINVDSVQMYKECNIGSAKPTLSEMRNIKHHLFDLCTPSEKNSAASFLRSADVAISDIEKRGKVVIACGGTTLYLKALLYGLADLPKGDSDLRSNLEELSNEDLFKVLQERDPLSAAKLHPNDRKRVIRALEVQTLYGVTASKLQAEHAFLELQRSAFTIIPCYSREELYNRIDKRTQTMLDNGLLAEVQALILKYGEDAPVLNTVGYAEAKAYLLGELKKEELAPAIAQATRRLAKRQLTFWRNEPQKRGWSIFMKEGSQGLVSTNSTPQSKRGVQKDFIPHQISFSNLCRAITDFKNKNGDYTVQIIFCAADYL
jgi:tRNA dimethylallyltransferase